MSSIRNRAPALSAAMLVAISLAGCMTAHNLSSDVPATPIDQYPPIASKVATGVQLAPHAYGLSPAQADALRDVVADWKLNGEGLIVVEAPACNCDEAAATALDARDALVTYGAPAAAIRMLQYDGGQAGPIRVSYQRLQTQVYKCGTTWDDLSKTGDNLPDHNFGCAVHSNLAAIVDQPADLVRPRASDPVNAARRQVVIEQYRAGDATTSEKNDGASAVLSDVARGD